VATVAGLMLLADFLAAPVGPMAGACQHTSGSSGRIGTALLLALQTPSL
jgi:hypothetical protein